MDDKDLVIKKYSRTAVALVLLCASPFCAREKLDPICAERVTQKPAGCDDEMLLPSDARAKKITSACELIGGEEALGSIGDYKLYNSRVRFIVQDVATSIGWAPAGGDVLDADVVRPAGSPGNDLFGESFLNVGGRTLRPATIAIIADGRDGNPAVVRVTGTDNGIPIIDSVAPTRPVGLEIVQDYSLEAGSRSLLVTTKVTNTGTKVLDLPVGDVILTRARVALASPGYGFNLDAIVQGMQTRGDVDVIVGEGQGVSYGWLSPSPYLAILDLSGVRAPINTELNIPPGKSASFSRRLIVGDGDFASVTAESDRIKGVSPLGHLSCSVAQTDGAPADNVGITITSAASSFVSHLTKKENGTYGADLTPGTYYLRASGPERNPGPVMAADIITDSTTTAWLTVPPQGLVSYDVQGRDFGGSPQGNIPAKIILQGPEEHKIYTHTGTGSDAVLPGTYSYTVSRGFAYGITTGTIQVLEGGVPATLSAVIDKVVDTTGWMNCDTHQHSLRSVDSSAPTELKIRDNLAEGVDSFVASEHDFIYDYTPDIRALGVSDLIKVFIGEEVSPEYAHFNGYPLSPCTSRQQNGAVLYYNYDDDGKFTGYQAPEIFRKLREAGAEIVQVNHPHMGQGLLTYLKFTPKTAIESISPKLFDLNFDAIEILNGKDPSQLDQTLPSWYSFLNQGVMKTAVGVSDSHGPGSEAGYARNYFPTKAAAPGRIDIKELVDAIRSHNVVLCGGPFISFSLNGSPIGSTLHSPSLPLRLTIKVQAPLWMDVSTVEVIANGVTLTTIPVTNTTVVRFDGEVTDSPSRDTWYAVIARGTRDLGPMFVNALAFSLTNPIWVDTDGNGKFDPPGI